MEINVLGCDLRVRFDLSEFELDLDEIEEKLDEASYGTDYTVDSIYKSGFSQAEISLSVSSVYGTFDLDKAIGWLSNQLDKISQIKRKIVFTVHNPEYHSFHIDTENSDYDTTKEVHRLLNESIPNTGYVLFESEFESDYISVGILVHKRDGTRAEVEAISAMLDDVMAEIVEELAQQ